MDFNNKFVDFTLILTRIRTANCVKMIYRVVSRFGDMEVSLKLILNDKIGEKLAGHGLGPPFPTQFPRIIYCVHLFEPFNPYDTYTDMKSLVWNVHTCHRVQFQYTMYFD